MSEIKKELIYKKISDVMKDVESIAKEQQGHNFKYRGIDDVYNMLHPILAKHGVFTVPNVLSVQRQIETTTKGSKLMYSVLEMEFAFYAEDGSSIKCKVIGEGMDSGDKSSNKAMSVAHKYAYLQVFSIPTHDPKDPDADSWDTLPPQVTDKNPEEYVCQISKKYKGMKLKEIGIEQALYFKDWLIKESEKTRTPLGPDATDFVNATSDWNDKIKHEISKNFEEDVPY